MRLKAPCVCADEIRWCAMQTRIRGEWMERVDRSSRFVYYVVSWCALRCSVWTSQAGWLIRCAGEQDKITGASQWRRPLVFATVTDSVDSSGSKQDLADISKEAVMQQDFTEEEQQEGPLPVQQSLVQAELLASLKRKTHYSGSTTAKQHDQPPANYARNANCEVAARVEEYSENESDEDEDENEDVEEAPVPPPVCSPFRPLPKQRSNKEPVATDTRPRSPDPAAIAVAQSQHTMTMLRLNQALATWREQLIRDSFNFDVLSSVVSDFRMLERDLEAMPLFSNNPSAELLRVRFPPFT